MLRAGQSLMALAGLLVLTFGAALVGTLASLRAFAFYGDLIQPSWAPPPTVFGPVWTVLYLMMAIAAFLVVQRVGWRAAARPLQVYVAQLVLNAAWTWFFFAWRLGWAAFAEILVLAGFIVWTIRLFWQVRPLAGLLLLPYLGWVGFATLLTWSLWRLNPGVL